MSARCAKTTRVGGSQPMPRHPTHSGKITLCNGENSRYVSTDVLVSITPAIIWAKGVGIPGSKY